MKVYRYAGMQECRNACIQLCRLQVCRYAGKHECMYPGIQVCRNAGMQV